MAPLIFSLPKIVSLLVICLLALYQHQAHAHSYLTRPEPYTRSFCKGRHCAPCPDFPYPRSRMANSESSPEVTWRRGQNVSIVWAKNNHDGGFIRLAIVPVTDRLSHNKHARLAFYHGCFEQNVFTCHGALCGADKTNRAFSRTVTIPSIIPDGVYMLAFLWYGGIHWRRHVGMFSDYGSCSYIRIRGGAPVQRSYRPFFDAGDTGRFTSTPPGKCLTSADEPEVDCKTGCDHVPTFFDVPRIFDAGNPERIYARRDYGYKVPFVTPSPKASNSPRPAISGRLCSGPFCCQSRCGICGGAGCHLRPGGAWACCRDRIQASGRKCSLVRPPCRRQA